MPNDVQNVVLLISLGDDALPDEVNRATTQLYRELLASDADRVEKVRSDRLEAGARSRRQVIILDSCYSGSFGRLPKGGVPTKEIFEGNSEALFERDKAKLEATGNGYGRHILAATEALQLAWEGDALRGEVENSFFTQFLVEGLTKGLADRNNDGFIDIEELYDHIREGMRAGKQTPIKRSLHADGKLIIARSPISPFERKQEQRADLLVQAEKAMERDDYSRAETLLKNVIQAETNDLLAETAQAMLEDLKAERTRARAYTYIKSLQKKGAVRAARTAWQRFSERYPDYDPDDLAAQLGASPKTSNTGQPTPSQPPPARGRSQNLPPSGDRRKERGGAETILPAPFAWVKIPAGQVTIEDKVLQVEPFAIAKYPLTNAQFAPFIEAGGYKEKKWWTEAGWEVCQKEKWTEPRYWQDKKWNGAEQPVVGVSWYEAVAYCRWLSNNSGQTIMLPTEQQWQYAAQGNEGFEYPWSNAWDGSRCRNSVGGEWGSAGNTSPVTAYEGKGDSPFGVVDMAGNVWEWCLTDYEKGTNDLKSRATYRVLRGGSWNSYNTGGFRTAFRYRISPNDRGDFVGFRVALSL